MAVQSEVQRFALFAFHAVESLWMFCHDNENLRMLTSSLLNCSTTFLISNSEKNRSFNNGVWLEIISRKLFAARYFFFYKRSLKSRILHFSCDWTLNGGHKMSEHTWSTPKALMEKTWFLFTPSSSRLLHYCNSSTVRDKFVLAMETFPPRI